VREGLEFPVKVAVGGRRQWRLYALPTTLVAEWNRHSVQAGSGAPREGPPFAREFNPLATVGMVAVCPARGARASSARPTRHGEGPSIPVACSAVG